MSTPLATLWQALEQHDYRPHGRPDDFRSRCPGHDGDNPNSLHVNQGDNGGALLTCFAQNCDVERILRPLGLSVADLFPEKTNGRREIAAYNYFDEKGDLLYQVVRFSPKSFRQRRPDGAGGWRWNLDETRRVLYRLPEVLEAVKAGRRVFVLEGEEDVHALERAGEVATCNPGGAGKWRPEYSAALAGAEVVVVADRDEPGREHARKVAADLEGLAASVEVVESAEGKDARDHLEAGRTVDEFVPQGGEAGQRVQDPEDGVALLEDVKRFVSRYVVLPSEDAANLLALWVLHTHALDAAWATPYLRITSAAPSSGKTLLLEVLTALTRRGWHAINPSVAVLYRKIDRQTPTLLLDEMDNYPLDERRDALAVLNAGYKRGAEVDRCKDNGDLEEFSAFCPKAYAGLDSRQLVDTLLSRSITLRLAAKLPHEEVEMWIAPLSGPDATALRDRCARWADEQDLDALSRHKPTLPDCLHNRSAEVWWALLTLAEHIGGDWPERARRAARSLSAGGDAVDEVSEQVALLSDVREAMGEARTISTETLLAKLNALDESPWGAKRRGEGLDARGLAKMLRPFNIRPKTVRVGGATPKGYHASQFADAFARHLQNGQQGQQGQHPRPDGTGDVAHISHVALFEGGDVPLATEEQEALFERHRDAGATS